MRPTLKLLTTLAIAMLVFFYAVPARAQGSGVGTLPNAARDASGGQIYVTSPGYGSAHWNSHNGGQIAVVAGDQVLRSTWISGGINEVVETTRRANETPETFSKRHDELVDARRRVRPPDPIQHGEHFNGIVNGVLISTWTTRDQGQPVMTTTLETYRYDNPLEPGNDWRVRHGQTLRMALIYMPGKA